MAPPSVDGNDAFARLGGLDAVYAVDLVRLVQRVDQVPDLATPLLRWTDGRRTLRLVVASAAVDERHALELLQNLVKDGVLRLVAGPAPVVFQPKAKAAPSEDASTWGDDVTVIDIPVLK